jgi:nucleoside-diphosphate-sugar epimerase
MNFTITRYFNVYGPAQDYRRVRPPATSAFIMALLKGKRPIINGDGYQRRDFIYVSDVNELNMRIMENPRSKGEVFNVGVGKNYSINELFEAVEAQLNTGIKPIYKQAMPGEARITLADISKAKKLLNWQPKVKLEEGLKRSIEFLRGKIK